MIHRYENKLELIPLMLVASLFICGILYISIFSNNEPKYTKYKIVDRIEKTSQSIFGTSYLYYVTYDTGDGLKTKQVDYNVYYNEEYYSVRSYE